MVAPAARLAARLVVKRVRRVGAAAQAGAAEAGRAFAPLPSLPFRVNAEPARCPAVLHRLVEDGGCTADHGHATVVTLAPGVAAVDAARVLVQPQAAEASRAAEARPALGVQGAALIDALGGAPLALVSNASRGNLRAAVPALAPQHAAAGVRRLHCKRRVRRVVAAAQLALGTEVAGALAAVVTRLVRAGVPALLAGRKRR